MHAMRILLMLIVCLAIGLGIYYVSSSEQQVSPAKVMEQQNKAQVQADAYKKSQEDMMKQLGQ